MSKAVFLDRDGTINVDTGYVAEISDLEFERKAIEGLKAFQEMGYKLIIITNQGGIARGYHTEEETQQFNDELCRRLRAQNVGICAVYYCPHYKEGSVRSEEH